MPTSQKTGRARELLCPRPRSASAAHRHQQQRRPVPRRLQTSSPTLHPRHSTLVLIMRLAVPREEVAAAAAAGGGAAADAAGDADDVAGAAGDADETTFLRRPTVLKFCRPGSLFDPGTDGAREPSFLPQDPKCVTN